MSTSDYSNAIPVCGLGQEAVLWDIKIGALPLGLLKTRLRARHLLGGGLQRAKCGTCEKAQVPTMSCCVGSTRFGAFVDPGPELLLSLHSGYPHLNIAQTGTFRAD